MLSEKDKQFMQYWEKEREKQNTFLSKILSGLPMAFIFSLPILLFVFAVYLFFSGMVYQGIADLAGDLYHDRHRCVLLHPVLFLLSHAL